MGLRVLSLAFLLCLSSSMVVGASRTCASKVLDLTANHQDLESNFESIIQNLAKSWDLADGQTPRPKIRSIAKPSFRLAWSASIFAGADIRRWQEKVLSELSWQPNYWEMRQSTKNSIALLAISWNLGRRPSNLRSLVAFSFLHPLVDGPLDRGEIPLETIQRIREGLLGASLLPSSPFERDLFHLLSIIEESYPLAKHPRLRWILERLFEAQVNSIKVQRSTASSKRQLLLSSLRKGGLCLALSNYIALGSLSDEEFDFSIREGGLLQLLDDLGDALQDRNEGIRTLFTEDFGEENSWEIIRRMISIQDTPSKNDSETLVRMKEIALASLWVYLGRMARFEEPEIREARRNLSQFGWLAHFAFEASFRVHRYAFRKNLPRLVSEPRSHPPGYFLEFEDSESH